MARTDAAGKASMPLSPHKVMKCVCTRPLVLSPQIKKVPAKIQNVCVLAASAKAINGVLKFKAKVGPDAEFAALAALGNSPNDVKPISDGRLLINRMTNSAIKAQPTTIGRTETRQPTFSINQVAIGKKSNCPVAVLAEKIPKTRPLFLVNQRLETTAPKTSAVIPVPTPNITPHNTNKCHRAVT